MKKIIVFLGRNWLRDNIHIKYWVCKCNPPPQKKPHKKKTKTKNQPHSNYPSKAELKWFLNVGILESPT